jgi:hypothetical protein
VIKSTQKALWGTIGVSGIVDIFSMARLLDNQKWRRFRHSSSGSMELSLKE